MLNGLLIYEQMYAHKRTPARCYFSRNADFYTVRPDHPTKTIHMKQILFLTLVVISLGARAQVKSIDPVKKYESTVEFQKTQQPCTVLEFNYPAKDVEKGIEELGKRSGAKMSSFKGWTVAKGARLENRGNQYYDVYYKVSGNKSNSTVYMIFAEPGENLQTRPTNGEGVAIAGVAITGAFVGSMGDQLGEYDLHKRISAQEDELKAAQKKYDNLVNEGKSLENKRQKLEKDITDNQNAQVQQQQEIDRLKGILDQTKSKKGN